MKLIAILFSIVLLLVLYPLSNLLVGVYPVVVAMIVIADICIIKKKLE